MIVPHYDAILHALGASREKIDGKAKIQIPVSFLNFLLLAVVRHGEFNEAGYLAENPDVAAAIRARKLTDAKEHYLSVGFFEGRRGALPAVDEDWYRKMNPDVANAVRNGDLESAQEHYDLIGAEEFRPPSRSCQQQCHEWKVALGKATHTNPKAGSRNR